MKKIKTAVSIILALVLLITAAAAVPAQAAVTGSEETGGGFERIFLSPGSAYRENTKWYAWTWFDWDSFEDGSWLGSVWTKDSEDNDIALFDFLAPNVVFVCVPASVAEPDWSDVIYQSPETEIPDENYAYKVTGVNRGDKPNLTGKWYWIGGLKDPTEPGDDPYESGDVSHNSFYILTPSSTDTYFEDDYIQVLVGVLRYYYSYSANGSRMNYPNSVVLEFSKNGQVVNTLSFQYHAEDIGSVMSQYFFTSTPGVYTVRVGFSKESAYSVTNANYVGKYTYRILAIGDVDGNSVTDIRDVTLIKRYVAEYTSLTEDQLRLADTNRDGEVTIEDATYLQRYLADFNGMALIVNT